MATIALSPTTAVTTLAKLQRKVQGEVLWAVQRSTPEWNLAATLPNAGLDMSAREVTQPIVVTRQTGGAMIPEFGYEADPRTLAPVEATYAYSIYNNRFSISVFARLQDQLNRKAMLNRQIQFQTMRQAEAMRNRFARTFYGLSSGLLARISNVTTSATPTFTLIDAYGLTESAADNKPYLAGLFSNGARIAVIRSGAIISNGLCSITAEPDATNGQITCATNSGSTLTSAANDEIYSAESVQNDATTIDSTDKDKWPPGLLDATESTSLHSVSSATYPNWAAALNDTTGGRFNGTRLMKAQDSIMNLGGGEGPWHFICTQGVKRDIFSQQVAAVRFQDPMTMRLDGAVKVGEGVTQFTSRFVPPQRAFLRAAGSTKKWLLTPMPNEEGELPDWNDHLTVDKIENRAGYYVSVELIYSFIHQRNNYVTWSQLTES